jgi:hypothetical protein
MSVLSEQFARMRRVTKAVVHDDLSVSVWVSGNGYSASCSCGCGNKSGTGATPEEAIRDAVGTFVQQWCR